MYGVFAGIYVVGLLDARLMQKLLGAFIAACALCSMIVAQLLLAPAGRCSTNWDHAAAFVGSVVDSIFGRGGGLLAVI